MMLIALFVLVVAIVLGSVLEGALKAVLVLALAAAAFVFCCDFLQVDYHVVAAHQYHVAERTVARHARELRDLR